MSDQTDKENDDPYPGTTRRARGRGPNEPSLLSRAGLLFAVLVLWSAAPAGVGHAAPAVGFYLRAGAGIERAADTRFTDEDCASTSPAALYGCGTGGDGAPYRSAGDFGTATALELGSRLRRRTGGET